MSKCRGWSPEMKEARRRRINISVQFVFIIVRKADTLKCRIMITRSPLNGLLSLMHEACLNLLAESMRVRSCNFGDFSRSYFQDRNRSLEC
jgi:hypothetical protein